jgi:Zn-dependent M28 family amino/carboxypeptidase
MRRGLAAVIALLLLAPAVPAASGEAVRFDAERAWRDLERIVGFGPRPSGSPALERTRAYLLAELRRAGVRARRQTFTARTEAGTVTMTNIIAELPGRRPDVVVIGGHYDTKLFRAFRFVGANDGGSSAALLLELARALARGPREYTVWIVFFDGEEGADPEAATAPLHGSRHFVEELARGGRLGRVRAAVVADMIGDRDLDIRRDGGSAPWLNGVLWRTAERLGHERHFLDEVVHVLDDHVPFLHAGVPAALLIDFNYPHWHTAGDTLDKVSRRSLEVVGAVLLEALPEIEAALGR